MVLQCQHYFHPFKVSYYRKYPLVLSDWDCSSFYPEGWRQQTLYSSESFELWPKLHDVTALKTATLIAGVMARTIFYCSDFNSHRRPTLPATVFLVQLTTCSKILTLDVHETRYSWNSMFGISTFRGPLLVTLFRHSVTGSNGSGGDYVPGE